MAGHSINGFECTLHKQWKWILFLSVASTLNYFVGGTLDTQLITLNFKNLSSPSNDTEKLQWKNSVSNEFFKKTAEIYNVFYFKGSWNSKEKQHILVLEFEFLYKIIVT